MFGIFYRAALAFLLGAGHRPTLAAPELEISSAIELRWHTQPNRLYQIVATDDLNAPVWKETGSPVLGTGALVRKVIHHEDTTLRFFRVIELDGVVTNWIAGLSDVRFRTATLVGAEDGIRAEGIRATAASISIEDYVTTRFQFDLESQSLKLVQFEVVPRIGVFQDRFFARDVPAHPLGTLNDKTVSDYAWRSASGTNIVLTVMLVPGQVFNFGVRQASREYALDVIGPDGQQVVYSTIRPSGTTFVKYGIPVLREGQYQVRIRPWSNSASPFGMTCQVFFANSNATSLQDIVDGARISSVMRSHTQDYAKYRLKLRRGEVLRLGDASSGVGILILNSSSEKVAEVIQGSLIFAAPEEDNYYIFVYRVQPTSGNLSYSSVVSVASE